MCGRYASSRSTDDLISEFGIESNQAGESKPDYNVAPSKKVPAVVERPAHDERPKQRQLRQLTWGLIPSWAKDPAIGNRMINARVESVAEKPSFRRALATRRVILPADGYYEWYQPQQQTEAGRPRKQPFFIHPRDNGVLAMAGLYEIWRDPSRPDQDPDQFRWTCTVLTTAAEPALARIHDRMPLILTPDLYDVWLDPDRAGVEVLPEVLAAARPGRLEAHPVSAAVSDVRNNGPALIDAIRLD